MTFTALALLAAVFSACERSQLSESKVLGTWQYTTIDNVGQMTFSRDHKVTLAFPLEIEGRHGFTVVGSGTWKLEGNDLRYELDFVPPDHEAMGTRIPIKIERLTILEVRRDKLFFFKGPTFERVK